MLPACCPVKHCPVCPLLLQVESCLKETADKDQLDLSGIC